MKEFIDKGIYLYGTLKTNMGVPQELIDHAKQVLKERGDWVFMMAPPSLLCVIWKDSVNTHLLSTCHQPIEANVVRRLGGAPGISIRSPLLAKDYNLYMGSCDQCNSLRKRYNISRSHHRRWYMSMVYYGMEIMIINSFVIFKSINVGAAKMSHLSYRKSIMLYMQMQSGTIRSENIHKRRRIDGIEKLPDERLHHPGQHYPEVIEERRNCKYCYAVHKVQLKTKFICCYCKVPLHINGGRSENCFRFYHTHQ